MNTITNTGYDIYDLINEKYVKRFRYSTEQKTLI